MIIKTAAGEKICIIESVAPQWVDIGALLDFDPEGRKLKLIEVDHGQKGHVACCREMFMHWLDGNGKQATWNVLIEVLDDIGKKELANRVKAAIETVKLCK